MDDQTDITRTDLATEQNAAVRLENSTSADPDGRGAIFSNLPLSWESQVPLASEEQAVPNDTASSARYLGAFPEPILPALSELVFDFSEPAETAAAPVDDWFIDSNVQVAVPVATAEPSAVSPGGAVAGNEEAPEPETAGLLTDFQPADPSTLDAAFRQLLSLLDGLGSTLGQRNLALGVVIVLAVAAGAAARRKRQREAPPLAPLDGAMSGRASWLSGQPKLLPL